MAHRAVDRRLALVVHWRLRIDVVQLNVHILFAHMEADMQVLTYTDARANLKSVMQQVVEDHEEVVVTRKNGRPVVMMSLDAWNSIRETMHLLSTPANARALRESIAQLDAGKGVERELVETAGA